MTPSSQKDLFSAQTGNPSIVIELKGIVVHFKYKRVAKTLSGIPTFKSGKKVLAWIGKAGLIMEWMGGKWWARRDTIRIQSTLLTLPQHQKWMDQAILSIESQLRSALRLTDEKIRTVASPRSWIASYVPLDDSWTWVPEIVLKSEKCDEGQEGATIVIERIR